MLGIALMVVYAASGGAYLVFVVYGYRAADGRFLIIGWTFIAALAASLLVVWITLVNLVYLLLQIAMAIEDVGLVAACGAVARFVRAEFREVAGIFGVVLGSRARRDAGVRAGVVRRRTDRVRAAGRPRRVPVAAGGAVLRGLVFEYIGLTALAAYATLYHRHVAQVGRVSDRTRLRRARLDDPAR